MKLLVIACATAWACIATSAWAAAERPNILWISAEDISPDLGCYGDPYAITPQLDQLANQGVRYTRCFAHAGVCAPARSGLITGMYPPSIGTQHMRCQGVPPVDVRCFPEYLRAAGYYCTNNSKTDYQFAAPDTAWDESSGKADWRGRNGDQPFFCVINFTTSHESQIRAPSPKTQELVADLPSELRHDPAAAIVPPYYPDTPVVRRDLANYADNITAMDRQVAEVLKRLEQDGLADDTIVWFWGDHGRGLPRCKRWLYDSGTHVPLIVRVPEKWRARISPTDPELLTPGTVNTELVAFVDFAPTVLSLAGVDVPRHFQGQAFLGPQKQRSPRQYMHGHRDRMDEAYDLIRMVRDERFKYFRNYLPDVSYGQDIWYMNQMPTLQEMRRLHADGALSAEAAQYFRPNKPVEELFDTEADPHELQNLADDPKYANELQRLRTECQRWMQAIGDVGLIPESLFDELQRPGGVMQQAPIPAVTVGPWSDGMLPVRSTTTIPGASLAYALNPDLTRPQARPRWQLLPATSIPAAKGDRILVKACRLGFADSEPLSWEVGVEPPQVPLSGAPQHWRQLVDSDDLLARLQRIKAFDGRRDEVALAAYAAALTDPSPAVRYWGLRGGLGIVANSATAGVRNGFDWQAAVRRLRQEDPAPLIRVLAAKSLAEWERDPAHVKFLAEMMRQGQSPSLRLQAAILLRELGEGARLALPQLEGVTAKDGEYVNRVARETVARLQSRAE